MNRDKMQQLVLWILAVSFPLLYLSVVSIENTVMTISVLGVIGASAIVSMVVY